MKAPKHKPAKAAPRHKLMRAGFEKIYGGAKLSEPRLLTGSELARARMMASIAEKMGAGNWEQMSMINELICYRALPNITLTVHEHHCTMGTIHVCEVKTVKGETWKLNGAWPMAAAGIEPKAGERYSLLVAKAPQNDPKVKPTKNPFMKCYYPMKNGKPCGRIGAERCKCGVLVCDKHKAQHRCRRK